MAENTSPSTTEGETIAADSFRQPLGGSGDATKIDTRDFEPSSRPGKRPRLNPPPMTAAAALHAEAQQKVRSSTPSTQTSPNPASQALSALKGTPQNEMSKAADPSDSSKTDPATTMSAPMAVVADTVQNAAGDEDAQRGESHAQTSPVSISSIGTLASLGDASGMTTTVGSPLPLEETARQASNTADAASTSPEDGNKSFSYPVPLLTPQASEGARRGMSLPHSATRQGTRSPSSKKHRCPYCATEFTRHHNLKSHLLTHSQEKPYVCSTCNSRFRRLHDLKRHSKLHTGERPHICPKCGRKFARGDALARHNKGPGGCAGRRASMGDFGGDDDFDGADDSMEGVMYGEPEDMNEEEGNEKRPGIRRQAPSGDDTVDDHDHRNRMPSTYPPIQGRPPGGIASGNFPPRGGFGPVGSGSGPSGPQAAPMQYPAPAGSTGSSRSAVVGGAFAQNPLTESPKPLSPGQGQRGSGPVDSRNRSPSMHFGQQGTQSYPRSAGGSGSSFGLPGSTLPPPPGLNPPDARYTLPSQGAPTHPPTQPTGPPTQMTGSGPLSSHSNSLSSKGASGHGSGEAATSSMFAKEDRLFAMVHSLEQRVNNMQQEIDSLRNQLAVATGQPQPSRVG